MGVGLHLVDVLDGDAAQPLQRDLHRVAGQVDALVHARGHADLADEAARIDRSSCSPPATTSATMSPDSSCARSSARFSGAPICTAIVPSGKTIVERRAMSGSVGGSSERRISSFFCPRGMGSDGKRDAG
jgi:hypothetical protein